ncbi:TenA family transcriptional regulator [Haliangium ochraceum]|uniref:Putative pyrroloquinoline quinone (Coenzyme PQQ) biosynthesis protein C n=1 Tax=Haliangium ochraceum (strain DSM 14365 / JCM 11303 / SMP-2) TaxID=502025 RepID=D0LLF2_HALO1|nr:iron-containing redox enzyme family protein [Haliangium ochraceum]ACY18648.1 putative pyrroloquinoline quinone (coenzyme PQQ) biosynthesis protein C [Haliangium ochraceum DSM 14365]
MLNHSQFKKELVRAMKSRPTMEHPILTEFLTPQPNMRLARIFATQVYQLTSMFERYIAALFYRCPVREFRARLIENLYEEVTGKESNTEGHLELMERFIFALGITQEELDSAETLPETHELIEYRCQLVDDPTQYHKAAAAIMIASEGQTIQKKDGMNAFQFFSQAYGLSEHDLTFFSVHAAEDVQHVIEGIELVSAVCKDEHMQQEAIETVRITCGKFWSFYDGIERSYRAESGAN